MGPYKWSFDFTDCSISERFGDATSTEQNSSNIIMSAKITLVFFMGMILATLAVPMFHGEEEPPPQQPAYEVNPHFGFRRYFEMRYEPISIPYTQPEYSGPPPAYSPPSYSPPAYSPPAYSPQPQSPNPYY